MKGRSTVTIETRSLSKRYGRKYAIQDVSFTVASGKVTGFLGPNGAGKSTTLRAIVGLDHPTSGTALIGGRPYAELGAPLHEVGALLDARSAHRSRTARNHLRWVAATNRIAKSRVEEVIDLAGLSTVADKRVGGFSLGMGQRLGIAVALLGDPQTLILDEPVNGLDPDGVTWMRGLLRGLADEGRTVFLSSHLLGELSLIADHVIVIGKGCIIADKPLSELVDTTETTQVRTAAVAELVRVLTGPEVSTTVLSTDTVEVSGLSAEQIAERANVAGIVLYQIAPVTRSLEDAYNELTRDAVEYRATGAGS
jgi:ABC-2 type transport system ATP-binding protein